MDSILKNPACRMFYESTLHNLSNGVVGPAEKEILSYTPLPDSFIDPYVSQVVEAGAALKMTCNSLLTWIEEAKKASYFSKHFVTLSRMINNGVSMAARSLATLHANGEDPEQAPLSVQDLINVSSYHIRKSYLGVLQTSRSHPEIGERLLVNQLNWTNTLLRLYKTQEKLSVPVKVIREQEPLPGEAPAAAPAMLSPSKDEGFSGQSAYSEAGCFSSVRAYRPVQNGDRRSLTGGRGASVSGLPVSDGEAALLQPSAGPEGSEGMTPLIPQEEKAETAPEAHTGTDRPETGPLRETIRPIDVPAFDEGEDGMYGEVQPPSDEETVLILESLVRHTLREHPEAWEELTDHLRDPDYCCSHPEYAKVFRKLYDERYNST